MITSTRIYSQDIKKISNDYNICFKKVIKITICDTSLVNKIIQYIDILKDNDSLFDTYGYLKMFLRQQGENKSESLQRCFYLQPSFYYFNKSDSSKKFPLFYTKIYGKLILIYSDIINYGLTKTNKNQFARIVNRTLPKQKLLKFVNSEGNKITLNPVGHINIDKGVEICD